MPPAPREVAFQIRTWLAPDEPPAEPSAEAAQAVMALSNASNRLRVSDVSLLDSVAPSELTGWPLMKTCTAGTGVGASGIGVGFGVGVGLGVGLAAGAGVGGVEGTTVTGV